MLTPADISEAGQRHVESYLTSTGYHTSTHKTHHGIEIEARGDEENLLVHVIAGLATHELPALSTFDRDRVISKGMTLGYDSWLAKVALDHEGELASEIEWEQLNH